MHPEQNHPEPDIDLREQQLLSHALGELAPAECDALAESLLNDPAAKRAGAETKVIADALREAYETAELPAASPELLAALESTLLSTNSEGQTVTTKPKLESFESKTQRRRFSRLEIVLAIAVLLLGTFAVLLGAREAGIRELADLRSAVSRSDQSHTSAPAPRDIVDESKSMTTADDLDQRRMPESSLFVESEKPLGLRFELADASGDADYDGVNESTFTSPPDDPAAESKRVLSEYDKLTAADGKSRKHALGYIASQGQGAGQGAGGAPMQRPNSEQFADLASRRKKYASSDLGKPPRGESLYVKETQTGDFLARSGKDGDEKLGLGWIGGRIEAEPRRGGDQHARIYENAFKTVSQDPLSTFSIDVDTASYSKMRQHILEHGQLPPPDAVRIEELLNYFPYDYLEPMDEHPFAAHMEVAQCPWRAEHRLARIAIKGKEMRPAERPASNLVFLVDVSGSMNEPKRLPLVVRGLEMLTRELGKNDRVAIVVYAGAAGLVLPSTKGDEQETILSALGKLQAGGSTAGAEGVQLAYKTAEENFIHAGVNRVILCTDGDFNVGVSDTGSLVRLAEEQAKKNIFLSILGFGIGNLNDEMLEQVSNKANGMYAFIDTENEARKVLVEQMSGTLVTIAKDVKIQIEFNPAKVAAYRLIGYENRILAAEDFNDDKKDAGEIGAGHTVTALYEIVPVIAKEKPEIPAVDELKYQRPSELTDAADSAELLTLKLRYKSPEGDKSTLLSEPVDDSTEPFGKVSGDFKFAAAVASFGMLLRGSDYAGDATYDAVLEIATDGAKHDEWGYRKEFLEIVKRAKELKK